MSIRKIKKVIKSNKYYRTIITIVTKDNNRYNYNMLDFFSFSKFYIVISRHNIEYETIPFRQIKRIIR